MVLQGQGHEGVVAGGCFHFWVVSAQAADEAATALFLPVVLGLGWPGAELVEPDC